MAGRFDQAWAYMQQQSPTFSKMEGKLFNKISVKGGIAQLPFTALGIAALWRPEDLGNGRIHRNSSLEKLGGIGMAVGGLGLSMIPVVGAVMAAKAGFDIANMVAQATAQKGQYQKRSFFKANLSPIQTQRAFRSQQVGVSRIMDSMSFVGNEARHMAARGA